MRKHRHRSVVRKAGGLGLDDANIASGLRQHGGGLALLDIVDDDRARALYGVTKHLKDNVAIDLAAAPRPIDHYAVEVSRHLIRLDTVPVPQRARHQRRVDQFHVVNSVPLKPGLDLLDPIEIALKRIDHARTIALAKITGETHYQC